MLYVNVISDTASKRKKKKKKKLIAEGLLCTREPVTKQKVVGEAFSDKDYLVPSWHNTSAGTLNLTYSMISNGSPQAS